ncbi:Mu transposase C-terminal domain-containing protein [Algiphilus sp.]|uniref:Mu transposase C-terminal domain-containing protein n=2 Tax=Algiphilus sp. TaxID=1872431 RepID=UPI0025C0011E|nr:Mu transposase C-terminal domain-containing protein [Algiphilus sp.]MCK5772029.1 Mu transposase C-terminal domain-containing protein [Algiphilus sp.]
MAPPTVLPSRLADVSRQQLQRHEPTALEALPAAKREQVQLRSLVIAPVVDLMEQGLSVRCAAQNVMARIKARSADSAVLRSVALLDSISAPTLERWTRAYLANGPTALADRRQGRTRREYGWEARAAALYRQPTRPAYATVAYWLRGEGYDTATESRVRRYLQSLPSNQAETAPARTGRHWYDQNVRPHHRLDLDSIVAGEVYQGDGHRCDVYVQHPRTGRHFRPELWIWLDRRTTKVVGWWLCEDESAQAVQWSISAAIRAHDHVPTWAHGDPGPGIANRAMSDEQVGYFERLGITLRQALPGNAKGKGLVEGWFRWFEERAGKRFSSFCGHCRTDDALSRLETKVRRGEIEIPTWQQYLDAVRAYIASYNATPKEALDGRTPDQVWDAELQRNELHVPEATLLRPQRQATVRRWEVRLLNRYYRAAELAQYERRQVVVEYDLHDESRVWVRDDQQRLVCTAELVGKSRWASDSAAADARDKSRRGKLARLARKAEEVEGRHKPLLPAAETRQLEADDVIQFRRAAELDAQETEQLAVEESPAERFARAMRLEAAEQLDADDARWLEIYQTSAEYHSRRSLQEAFGGTDDTTQEAAE